MIPLGASKGRAAMMSKGKPSGPELIALGSGGPSSSTSAAVPVIQSGSKRTGVSVGPPVSGSPSKKPKLSFESCQVDHWELLDRIEALPVGDERILAYLMSAINTFKNTRGKDPLTMYILLYFSKVKPQIFMRYVLLNVMHQLTPDHLYAKQ